MTRPGRGRSVARRPAPQPVVPDGPDATDIDGLVSAPCGALDGEQGAATKDDVNRASAPSRCRHRRRRTLVRPPSSERAVAPHAPASLRERLQTPSAVAASLPLGTYIRAEGDGFGARPVLVERTDRIDVFAMIRTRASRPLRRRHIPIHPSCVFHC